MIELNAQSIDTLNQEFNLTRANLIALNKLIMEHFNTGDLYVQYYPAYGLCFNYYGMLAQLNQFDLNHIWSMRYLDVIQLVEERRVA